MTDTTRRPAAISGLIGLAATEEEMLLASALNGEDGSPDRWAAPLVAHNGEFRQQQVVRLHAVLRDGTPDWSDHLLADRISSCWKTADLGLPAHRRYRYAPRLTLINGTGTAILGCARSASRLTLPVQERPAAGADTQDGDQYDAEHCDRCGGERPPSSQRRGAGRSLRRRRRSRWR